jgi:hypothetical protein
VSQYISTFGMFFNCEFLTQKTNTKTNTKPTPKFTPKYAPNIIVLALGIISD